MAKEELQRELDRIEGAIFMEQMADFMDWPRYRELCAKRNELKERLAKI